MIPEDIRSTLCENDNGLIVKCYVQPKASKNSIIGLHGDSLKISVMSPPVDGKANKTLCKFLAKSFKISKSMINILSGENSRNKRVFIQGLSVDEFISRLSKNG